MLASRRKLKRRPHKVTVFTTPTCSWCRVLKDHLTRHQVRFKEVDVSRDRRAADDIVRRTGQRGVPVTYIGNEAIVGFDQARIDQLLGLAA